MRGVSFVFPYLGLPRREAGRPARAGEKSGPGSQQNVESNMIKTKDSGFCPRGGARRSPFTVRVRDPRRGEGAPPYAGSFDLVRGPRRGEGAPPYADRPPLRIGSDPLIAPVFHRGGRSRTASENRPTRRSGGRFVKRPYGADSMRSFGSGSGSGFAFAQDDKNILRPQAHTGGRKDRPCYDLQLFSTEMISNLSSPAGARTTTVSPARCPIRPCPRGESSEMRPAFGLASWLPTIS